MQPYDCSGTRVARGMKRGKGVARLRRLLIMLSGALATAGLSALTSQPVHADVQTGAAVIEVTGTPLSSITTAPPPLTPAFSQGTHDYVVRCQGGSNTITLQFAGSSGVPSPPSANVHVIENQAIVVRAPD